MRLFPGFTERLIRTSGATIKVVYAGQGEPVLLLHGYPQTMACWHEIAPKLAKHYTVICADLRGYGGSSKPKGLPDHSNYSKRAMAQDMVEVMQKLGHDRFHLVGHDRGGRVAHRLAKDHGDLVHTLTVLDISPTLKMFESTDLRFATAYYHWFFLIQPDGLPEHMIGQDPTWWLNETLRRWAAPGFQFDPAARAAYERAFDDAPTIHAQCEDYRAAATIDLVHDAEDAAKREAAELAKAELSESESAGDGEEAEEGEDAAAEPSADATEATSDEPEDEAANDAAEETDQ